jgi:hypothetical protein
MMHKFLVQVCTERTDFQPEKYRLWLTDRARPKDFHMDISVIHEEREPDICPHNVLKEDYRCATCKSLLCL